MKLELYDVKGFEDKLSKRPKEIVEALSISVKKKINKYDDIAVEQFVQDINERLEWYCDTVCEKVLVRGYLVDTKIQSDLRDGYCNGFAYWDNNYNVVVTKCTDVYSVLCHEIAHIIFYELISKKVQREDENTEKYVEQLEALLSYKQRWSYHEKGGEILLDSNQLRDKNFIEYMNEKMEVANEK